MSREPERLTAGLAALSSVFRKYGYVLFAMQRLAPAPACPDT